MPAGSDVCESTEILAPPERRVTDHFGPLILDGDSWWGRPAVLMG